MSNKNIIFIGMPSAGKSTIGRHLATLTGMPFLDIDEEILKKVKKPLSEVVANDGLARFLELQESVILGLKTEGHIIATGGSVVYSEAAMDYLKQGGTVIYLKLSLGEIEKRIDKSRRLARGNGQEFIDVYKERIILYEKYADFVIDCINKSESDIVVAVRGLIKKDGVAW
jgi:shikimate kinase